MTRLWFDSVIDPKLNNDRLVAIDEKGLSRTTATNRALTARQISGWWGNPPNCRLVVPDLGTPI